MAFCFKDMCLYLMIRGAIILSFLAPNVDVVYGAEKEFPADTLIANLEFGVESEGILAKLPDAAAVLPDGSVLISDTENNRLLRFTKGNNSLEVYGSLGSTEGHFYRPQDISLGIDRIYVADQGNRRIIMLSFELDWLGSINVDVYPDMVVPLPDKSMLVGSGTIRSGPRSYLFSRYGTNGKKLEELGAPLGKNDDSPETKVALNRIVTTVTDDGQIVICHIGLAHCRCGYDGLGWVIKSDINETREWFYRGTFPNRPLPANDTGNTLEHFIQDIRDKCAIDHLSSIPTFVSDIDFHDGNIIAVVSSAIHEYTCSGEFLKRSIVLDNKGKRVVFDRIAFSENGDIYLLEKFTSSLARCWRVPYH